MYVLACCNEEGKCVGFLRNDKNCEMNEENINDMEWVNKNLMLFKKKGDANEICNQINLSNMLLPNGYPFRVTPVKM